MTFTKKLIDWYHENKRDLPFRRQKDPYKIWVSEVMAQQTQINTMIPYYERWIARFPDVQTLANSDIEDVLKLWEGLGYYRRARNLHKGALFIMDNFNGELPASKKQLMEIPGIGEYTSSAIASIAFDLPEIAIDGNVKRVMARTLNYTENVNTRAAHVYFENYLKHELTLNGAKPSEFTQALMELGALVCTPSNTQCIGCPLKELCAAYRGETVGQVPFIPKAKPAPKYKKSVLIDKKDTTIVMSRDTRDGLMEGLYRLPQIEGHLELNEVASLNHKFSHLQWDIKAYEVDDVDLEYTEIVELSQLEALPIITAHKKILKKLKIL